MFLYKLQGLTTDFNNTNLFKDTLPSEESSTHRDNKEEK